MKPALAHSVSVILGTILGLAISLGYIPEPTPCPVAPECPVCPVVEAVVEPVVVAPVEAVVE
jgi:hypothetical protein